MPERVAAIIEPLREHGGEGDFIFSTTAGTKPIRLETLSHAVHDVSQGAYRQGDLRRTVETRLQALGVSRDVRAQLLSHGRQGGVQAAHYERYDYMKEKAEALAEWHQHLDRLYT
jgi:hypothetical protein